MADVDPLSMVPLYVQVAEIIRAAIRRGEYGPGDRLPSESTLTQTYGVSRVTARAAYRYLREAGEVVTVPQRGSYVPLKPS